MNAAERARAAIEAAAAATETAPLDVRQFVATDTRPEWWAGAPMTLLLAGHIERAARRFEHRAPEVAALCRAAASACVEAWQESRPRTEVREEALAALLDVEAANAAAGYSAGIGDAWQALGRPDDAETVYTAAHEDGTVRAHGQGRRRSLRLFPRSRGTPALARDDGGGR